MARKPKPHRERNKPRSHALTAVIYAYIKDHPDAQYHEMLTDLHTQGYRVNRNGNHELYRLWRAAREAAS